MKATTDREFEPPSEGALRELASVAASAAASAAAIVMRGYRSRPRADEKAARDLVTEFDRASQEAIVEQLASHAPGIPILAEEGAEEALASEGRRLLWCVDPLDGTTNFVHGHPFWCVSIGLMAGREPVLGVVVAPALALEWRGLRALAEGCAEATRNAEPCRVSTTGNLAHALIGTGFPPDRTRAPDNNFDSFTRVKKAAQGVRRCGSAAIDLCLVADGTYDAYWERRLHLWDLAAAGAVALAAGARITALDGGPPEYRIGHVAASNGRFHDALVAEILGPLGAAERTSA